MNPLALVYDDAVPSLDFVANPTAIIVTGRSNWRHPEFQRARARGAEVYQYLNVLNCPDNIGVNEPLLAEFWGDFGGPAPLWGNDRSNWPGTKLVDIRPESGWRQYTVSYIEGRVRSGEIDGLYLDTFGSHPRAAGWQSWPVEESNLWTACMVDFAREVFEACAAINSRFKIVHNNNWQHAAQAEQYCDGISIEQRRTSEPFHVANAAREYANRGQRRLLIIAPNPAEALLWSSKPGVTHVASVNEDEGENFQQPTWPVVLYSNLRPAEDAAYYDRVIADLRFDLAVAEGAKQAAIEQRDAAISLYDQAIAQRDQAESLLVGARTERDAATASCTALNDRLLQIKALAS